MKYLVDMSILFTIYGMFTYALRLFSKESKVLMISQITYFIIGAYTTAIGVMVLGHNVFPTVKAGILISFISSLIVFALFEHYKGNYKSVTLFGAALVAISTLISINAKNNSPLRSLGLEGNISREYGFSDFSFLMLCIIFFSVFFLIKKIVEHSSLGNYYESLPPDQQMAKPRARRYRRTLYIISAIISSAAGSFYATYVGYVDTNSYQLKEGIFILALLMVSGVVNLVGGIIGIAILISIPELFRIVGVDYNISVNLQLLIFAIAILVMFILYVLGFMEEDDYEDYYYEK